MPSSNGNTSESQPLLPTSRSGGSSSFWARATPKRVIAAVLTTVFIIGTVVTLALDIQTRKAIDADPYRAALAILDRHPMIDTHIDLPYFMRMMKHNNASAIDLHEPQPGHVDIPRLRKGRVGGFFWSVFTECPDKDTSVLDEFLNPTNSVRDTLEQIDIAQALIQKHPETFSFALTSKDIRKAIKAGKIASLMGIEGGHQFGNSIAAVRQLFNLGVRYATLTHSCHNIFADSAGIFIPPVPLYNGLSDIGVKLVHEMNRIGMIVDISHTSDATAAHVLKVTKAPVIWSHSSAKAVWDVPRNVPDFILEKIGTGPDKVDAVVQVNFAPYFVAAPAKADVKVVADHVEWIAKVAGKAHVGIGSDFDGIEETPVGLEDVSKYPKLFAELYSRGWSERDLAGLAGENLLRVMEGVEAAAYKLRNEPRSEAVYSKRSDL
ncbi:hypothetical protein DL93DRAFT_2079668 [Clavulina sp. PMI_390]|nr:hypothetical protein DL93DRAFT_2079668 [Clavulina sp. PMI_390]